MSREAIKAEVDDLSKSGRMIRLREMLASMSESAKEELAEKLAPRDTPTKDSEEDPSVDSTSDEKVKLFERELTKPSEFKRDYQRWYTRASRVVRQVLPERDIEFRGYYERDTRKKLDVSNYSITDYIAGIRVRDGLGRSVFDAHQVAMGKFETQLDILSAAQDMIDSYLEDLATTIQAGLLDIEINTARELLKAAYIRPAGVIAGVVLEAHLEKVAQAHGIRLRKKATLSNLNDALKENGTIDTPTWRRLQYLGDIRNLCAHKGEDEPTRTQVEDLIRQADEIIHTLQ